MHGPEDYDEKTSLLGDQQLGRKIAESSIQSSEDSHRNLVWPDDARPTHTDVWGTFPSSRQGGVQWRNQRPESRTSLLYRTVFAECCSVGGLMYFLIIAGLISIGLFLHLELVQSPPYVRKVAIIGAGPAGVSAAYNVQKFSQEEGIPVDITLYEKNGYVGGRATCRVNIGDSDGSDDYFTAQIAAKGFHTSDKNLVDTVDELNLTPVMLDGKEDTDLSGRSGDRWGVFDGTSIVYRQSHPTNFLTGWWWSLKLFYFYGYSPRNTQNTVTNTRSKIKRIHSPRFFPFESLSAVIQELDLAEETSQTGAQLLDKNSVSTSFQRDIVNGWTRRDFGQNLDQISGFAAMAAPDDGRDMTIEGGHWKLFEEMARVSEAEVKLNTSAFGVRRMEWGGWVIATQPANGDDPQDGDYEEFDSVILAAPYQLSNLEIKGEQLAYIPGEVDYTPLHVTLFRSAWKLSRGYFHHSDEVPETMLTTLGGDEFDKLGKMTGTEGVGRVGFYSVTSVKRFARLDALGVITEEFLYKIVSPEKVSDDTIYQLLGASPSENGVVSWCYRHEWPSGYPNIYPRTEFAKLKLDENFWYTGGIEELSSSMELSSLMGANVAKLVVDGWVREGRGNRPDRKFDEGEDGEETPYPETIGGYLKSLYEGARAEGGSDQREE